MLTVYYDGACPLCSREIGFLRRRVALGEVAWIDLADSSGERVATDLDRDAALARFHVRLADGRLVSGAAAFAALWQRTRGLRWLGRLAGSRLLGVPLESVYRAFLKVRPSLQRLVSGRVCDSKSGCGTPPSASVSSRSPSG
jgi:predicted DCC family thiol-disulfide oxidoreductase YuxK